VQNADMFNTYIYPDEYLQNTTRPTQNKIRNYKLGDDVNFIERGILREVSQQADIVLLELDKKVFFQLSISPICIVQETDEVKGKKNVY